MHARAHAHTCMRTQTHARTHTLTSHIQTQITEAASKFTKYKIKTKKHCMLCFFLINNVLFNLLFVCILVMSYTHTKSYLESSFQQEHPSPHSGNTAHHRSLCSSRCRPGSRLLGDSVHPAVGRWAWPGRPHPHSTTLQSSWPWERTVPASDSRCPPCRRGRQRRWSELEQG